MAVTDQLHEIKKLCEELGLDPHMYAGIKEHGRLVYILAHYCMFKKGDLLSGRIAPPDPKDFMGAKK